MTAVPADRLADPTPPRWRRRAVTLGLVAFLLASAFDTVTGTEHWPFSPYAMYARIKEDYRSRKFYLYGVTPDGREVAMDSRDDLAPFDRVGLHTLLLRLGGDAGDRDARAVRTVVQDVADRHERRRLAGGGGEAFGSVRLYRLVWDMDPTLSNLDVPEERDLVLEVVPDGGAP